MPATRWSRVVGVCLVVLGVMAAGGVVRSRLVRATGQDTEGNVAIVWPLDGSIVLGPNVLAPWDAAGVDTGMGATDTTDQEEQRAHPCSYAAESARSRVRSTDRTVSWETPRSRATDRSPARFARAATSSQRSLGIRVPLAPAA